MAKVELDEKTGNAVLVCPCGSKTDKGCPPIPGQDDSAFMCEACQHAINKSAVEQATETTELSGS